LELNLNSDSDCSYMRLRKFFQLPVLKLPSRKMGTVFLALANFHFSSLFKSDTLHQKDCCFPRRRNNDIPVFGEEFCILYLRFLWNAH